MRTHLFLLMAGLSMSAASLHSAVIQVGTGGGMTSPGTWSSGDVVTNGFTALTVDSTKFGELYDSASGYVGGGTVTGDLYYAFTARSLDRMGTAIYCPTNMSSAVPFLLGASFAGGQLVGAAPSLNVGEAFGRWAYSFNIGTNGGGSANEFPTRLDPAPARVALIEVHVHYNSSAADNATVTLWTYDNLPGQRQPVATDAAASTQTLATVNSDFSFNTFQFISGHADTTPCTRWLFSNVVFAQNAGEAPAYLLTHPVNNIRKWLIQLGTGGRTNEVAASSPATNFVTAVVLTADAAGFGNLYDSASGFVGGGAVSGEVFYAFTARSLDRTGDTCLPAGSIAYQPNNPGYSGAGGQLINANPSLGIGQKAGNWGMGWFTATNCTGGGDFGPRIDAATNRVSLFEVRLRFAPSGNDTAYVTHYVFDGLPNQRQPTATDTPAYMRSLSISGDFSFNKFQFVTGHSASTKTRWVFSNVVFTRDPATAALYLLAPPPSPFGTTISLR
jgi:hypothetical protein